MKRSVVTQILAAKTRPHMDELTEEFEKVFDDIRNGRIHIWVPRHKIK